MLIQKKLDEQFYEREFNARRQRLGANPVEIIKSNLQQEIIKTSPISRFMKECLKFDDSPQKLAEYFEILLERAVFDVVN